MTKSSILFNHYPNSISIYLLSSTTNTLTSFLLPSNDQLMCLLTNSISSSSLDPIPLKLLNDIASIILYIAYYIHESLTSCTVPLIFKNYLITPIIKNLLLTLHPLITIYIGL